jgi:hypothetical protein
MRILGSLFAVAVMVVAVIASTSYGRNELPATVQIAPLHMMVDQNLAPQRTTDLTVVFE